MSSTLEDRDWRLLLTRIRNGECTPFLGAGACYGVLPLGAEIAGEWAQEYSYPLDDSCQELARVSQFLAVEYDNMFPKGELARKLQNAAPPDFSKPHEPHSVLADFPLPIYITTNYDNFMMQALTSRNRAPKQELCQWNELLKNQPSVLGPESDFEPTAANPVVFHLHGHFGVPQSMVLTEDDYLDFLVEISRYQELLPPRIEEAFASTSLLFLGYRLTDWDFRVLFRSIVSYLAKSLGMTHVSVQLVPGGDAVSDEQREKAREYLGRYFDDQKIRVYWGTCQEFITELKERWEEFSHGE
ncbi:SIR2 family protein [Candidatus Poribacteria bacterium]